MKVLMVCLGNICRSPMAEGILRHKARAHNLSIETDSCGTGGWHAGEQPDNRAMANLLQKGIDISDLRARQFQPNDFNDFDKIYCMDQSNYNDIMILANSREDKEKVKMILNEVNPGANKAVPDPYYGGVSGFENVYQLLDEACEVIINQKQES